MEINYYMLGEGQSKGFKPKIYFYVLIILIYVKIRTFFVDESYLSLSKIIIIKLYK